MKLGGYQRHPFNNTPMACDNDVVGESLIVPAAETLGWRNAVRGRDHRRIKKLVGASEHSRSACQNCDLTDRDECGV
jgi:hypothetical protein